MPSGWDVYYVVFLSSGLALTIPAILWLFSFVFTRKQKIKPAEMPDSPPFVPHPVQLGRRMNVRFFLAANAALVLMTLVLVLIPCVGSLSPSLRGKMTLTGLLAVISISSSAVLGLLYSAKKGNLAWLRTFQHAKGHARPEDGEK